MNDEEIAPVRSERRDAAENRQRILKAALMLFERHGTEQVSMNQIAAEAQIGPGTLYRRYRNKSELCLDLIKDHVFLLFEDIEAYLAQNRAVPPAERLKELIRCFIRFREQKSRLLVGVEDAPAANRGRPSAQSPLYHELHQHFVRLFDEIGAAGRQRPDSVFSADMLLLALTSDAYRFQRGERGRTPEQILDQLCLAFI